MADATPEIADLLSALRARVRPTLVVRQEPPATPATVALLAGSFDPPTVAHAAMAEAAASLADLVVLVYSVRTLPKEGDAGPPLLTEEERVAALDAFCGARGYAVGLCSHGLLADQVGAAAERFPGAEIVVIVGSDKLLQVLDPKWYEDVDAALSPMFERAAMAFSMRAGDEEAVGARLADEATSRWRRRIGPLDVPPEIASISSRRVRELLALGNDAGELVPEEVRGFLPR